MSFELFEDRIAVIPDEESETTDAGLLLVSDSARESMRYGTVAVVGKGHRGDRGDLIPIDVEPGARVFWSRPSGSEITVEGTKYLFLASREIVGVLKD